MQFIQNEMNHYGYWILTLGLMLEVLALPLPGEFMMSYAGLMVYQGKLSWPLAIMAAAGGSMLGMTAAYWIGYALGVPFFEKVGPRIHLGPDKLKKVSSWFDRYGNKVLLIAYFIPGVRHFTGYFSGVTRLPFRTFALFAYTGAFLWTGIFITLGKLLGPQWEKYQHTITRYLLLTGILVVLVLAARHLIRQKKLRWKENAAAWIDKGYRFFESTGRVGALIAVGFAVCLAAIVWAAGIIQDFLAMEYSEFDQLAYFIVHEVFDEPWRPVMERMLQLSSLSVLLALTLVNIMVLLWQKRLRLFEVVFYLFGVFGGIGWEIGLRRLFHREGPNVIPYSFPSEPVILTVIFVGFAAYFAVRSIRIWRVHMVISMIAIAVCLLSGIADIWMDRHYPSDVTAAYAFGGVWISFVIVFMEVYRLLQTIRNSSRTNQA
jgi:membrane protein DedA with SNARE-associated domain